MATDRRSSGSAIAAGGELRPHANLLLYYLALCALAGPFFFLPLAPLLLRYRTLRYRFDEEGISMRRGALFRREIRLNYGRIQDIHLTSNLLERWLGLGKVRLQTASGASTPEMVIEGLQEVEAVRDLLYERMLEPDAEAPTPEADEPAPDELDLAAGLAAVADELRAIRRLLEGGAVAAAPRDAPER